MPKVVTFSVFLPSLSSSSAVWANQRVGRVALGCGAAVGVDGAVDGPDLDRGTGAFDAGIDFHFHALARERVDRRIAEARGLELVEPAAPVVQHDGGDVGRGKERLELVVPGERAVHVVDGLRKADAHAGNARGPEVVRLYQSEKTRDDRLDRARCWP